MTPNVDTDPVTLERLGPNDTSLLSNLLELYSHDLSDLFSLEVGADGRFGYGRLPFYWSEPDKRRAFLIRHGTRVAGFILTQAGSPIPGVSADFDMTEFFVLRGHRRAGVGRRAACELWKQHPGSWMVRVAVGNEPARAFWENVVNGYTTGRFTRSRRSEDGRDWNVLAFSSVVGPQLCPICKAEVTPSARYPKYVCIACSRTATSVDGRRVEFWDYPDFGGRYVDTREPYDSEECYVAGVRCYAAIAYMGGTVIRPST